MQRVTNKDILRAIDEYRTHVSSNLYGPPSLDALANYMDEHWGLTISRAGLSLRVNDLVESGYLIAVETWTCTHCGKVNETRTDEDGYCEKCSVDKAASGRIKTPTLLLSDRGRTLFDGDVEGS